MASRELTDEQWTRIELLLPPQPRIGRPRVDDRKVDEGVWERIWQALLGTLAHRTDLRLGGELPPFVRYERLISMYAAFFTVACVLICLRMIVK